MKKQVICLLAATSCHALVVQAQTHTTVYDMPENVKHYSVENVSDPIISGDVDEKVMAGTIYDFTAAGNSAIHFMTVKSDGTILVSKYFDDPQYDDERVVDIVSNGLSGAPGSATYFIISLARHPQVGIPPTGNDEIRITAVDVNGNQVGNSMILTDGSQSVYPLNAIHHSDGFIYICGYATGNYTNLPQQPSFGGVNSKKGFIAKYDPNNPFNPVPAMTINTVINFGYGTPTEDYDIAMRLVELGNGDIFVTGSVNDTKYDQVNNQEIYCSATMNLVVDQNLAVISDNHFINDNGGYEYGTGLIVDAANGSSYVVGNYFTHTPGMGPYVGFDPEPTALWITRLDNMFTPVTTPGINSRYTFNSFSSAWGLQTLEAAGSASGSAYNRFLIAGLQTGEFCSAVTFAPDVEPFIFDVEVSYTAGGGIAGNFINWVSYENLTGTGNTAPNSYHNLGGGISNYAWNPTFAARTSTSNDIVMSIPKWNASSNLLNLKIVRADFSTLLEPSCTGSTLQYDGWDPCPANFIYEHVSGNGYTPKPGMGEAAYITKHYGPLSVVQTISNPNTGDYDLSGITCDSDNPSYKKGLDVTRLSAGDMLNVYPNPANDNITVTLPANIKNAQNLKLLLSNMYGQIVEVLYDGSSTIFTNNISLSSLPAGTYVLQAFADGNLFGNVKVTICN